MAGYKYSIAVSKLEDHRALHPDAHILFIQMKGEQPDVITPIMKNFH